MSTGECQRVAIARALAGDPAILMADEPTAALDAENGQAIMRLFTDLVRDRCSTLLVVTHDNRIFPFADRILRLSDGRLPSGEVAGPAAGGGRRPLGHPDTTSDGVRDMRSAMVILFLACPPSPGWAASTP